MASDQPKKTTEQDLAIGARVAALRTSKGMSQTALATTLGVSFQQVQKYEKGKNRIGAGRLQTIASVLGVSVAALFAGDDDSVGDDSDTLSMYHVEGTALLVRAYASIDDEQVRKDVLNLVRSAARVAKFRKEGAESVAA